MIDYDYLKYWADTIKSIDLLQKLIQNNLDGYIRSQDVEYLEYITSCVDEIKRLRPLKEEYYLKTFNTI